MHNVTQLENLMMGISTPGFLFYSSTPGSPGFGYVLSAGKLLLHLRIRTGVALLCFCV
jgi:hypothetical protein